MTSSSVSSATGLFFQLSTSLRFFLTEEANGDAIGCVAAMGVKLALAPVDATDCAIEGTVSCTRREEGRPVRTGIPSSASVAGFGD